MSATTVRKMDLSEEGATGIIEGTDEEAPLMKRMGVGYCKVTTIHGLQYMPRTPVLINSALKRHVK